MEISLFWRVETPPTSELNFSRHTLQELGAFLRGVATWNPGPIRALWRWSIWNNKGENGKGLRNKSIDITKLFVQDRRSHGEVNHEMLGWNQNQKSEGKLLACKNANVSEHSHYKVRVVITHFAEGWQRVSWPPEKGCLWKWQVLSICGFTPARSKVKQSCWAQPSLQEDPISRCRQVVFRWGRCSFS